MRSILVVLLVIGSIAGYFILATGYGVFQPVPWLHLLVAVGACVWAVVEARRQPTRGRFAALIAAVALTGLFAWYTLDYSSYRGEPPPSFAVGDRFAELARIELPDSNGQLTPLLASKTRERATLIVFYRGFW